MKNIRIEEIILEYLDEKTPATRKLQLEEIIKKEASTVDKLELLQEIYKDLKRIQIPAPSDKLDENFYNMIEEHKDGVKKRKDLFSRLSTLLTQLYGQRFVIRLAYGMLLLILGWILGYWFTPSAKYETQINVMTAEIKEMKELVSLTLLSQPSPVDRIKAINHIKNQNQVPEKIINALIQTLNFDPNANVRLVAIEALLEFSGKPMVREALIKSIDQQESPLVQLALADIAVILNEKNAVQHLKQLLKRKELNDVVREKIEKSINILI